MANIGHHFAEFRWDNIGTKMLLPIEVKIVSDRETISQLGPLRYQAWVSSGVNFKDTSIRQAMSWLDDLDFDPRSVHFVAYYKGHIIGAARVSVHDEAASLPEKQKFIPYCSQLSQPIAALSRCFVLKDFRGLGIGALLTMTRLQYLSQNCPGLDVLIFTHGANRLKGLKRLGFRTLASGQDSDNITGPSNRAVMVARTDALNLPESATRPFPEQEAASPSL